jgi:hypothetical protein
MSIGEAVELRGRLRRLLLDFTILGCVLDVLGDGVVLIHVHGSLSGCEVRSMGILKALGGEVDSYDNSALARIHSKLVLSLHIPVLLGTVLFAFSKF